MSRGDGVLEKSEPVSFLKEKLHALHSIACWLGKSSTVTISTFPIDHLSLYTCFPLKLLLPEPWNSFQTKRTRERKSCWVQFKNKIKYTIIFLCIPVLFANNSESPWNLLVAMYLWILTIVTFVYDIFPSFVNTIIFEVFPFLKEQISYSVSGCP